MFQLTITRTERNGRGEAVSISTTTEQFTTAEALSTALDAHGVTAAERRKGSATVEPGVLLTFGALVATTVEPFVSQTERRYEEGRSEIAADIERRAARVANVLSDWKGKEIVLPSGRVATVGEHRHGTVRLIRTTGPNVGDSVWYPAEEIWQGLEDGTILTPDQLTATLPAAVVEIGQSCRVGTELDAAVELVAADTEWANVTRQAGFAESCVFAAARRYAEAGGVAFTAERATDAAVMVHRAYEACKAAGISAARAVELARDIRAARRAARHNRGSVVSAAPLNDVAAERV